ncbi:CAT RNA binding domain-containing protein [Enterococcus cecorum]
MYIICIYISCLGYFFYFLELKEAKEVRYRVIKPLNNNVAIVRTDQENQAIVMGSASHFKRKREI